MFKLRKLKISKEPKRKYSKQNIVIIVLSVLVGMLVIGMAIGGFFMSFIWQNQMSESNLKITTLILQAVDDLDIPIPIDAQTGKAYIPQVRLVLPIKPSTIAPELEYRYSAAQGEFPEELSIPHTHGIWRARSAMIGARTFDDIFNIVPKLQACSRGYKLSFSPKNDEQEKLIFTKKLADGRDLYVYLENVCDEPNEDFENYLKQINSY